MLQRIEYAHNPTLATLARGTTQAPAFLNAAHIEAAVIVMRLFERAQLQKSIMQNYAQRVDYGGSVGGELGEMALDARKILAQLHAHLAADCLSVVMDVCGYEKSLTMIETERIWPRRSAKMVLRIGLEQIGRYMNLNMPKNEVAYIWQDAAARPTEFY